MAATKPPTKQKAKRQAVSLPVRLLLAPSRPPWPPYRSVWKPPKTKKR